MKKRDRNKRNARREPFKEPKPTILVVCEGRVTEKQYLEGFKTFYQNPRVDIQIHPGVGVPKAVVKKAKKLKEAAINKSRREKDEFLAYDQVWCVFDRDQHPYFMDSIAMALANGIELAISNPSIELWLWLHFAEPPGPRTSRNLESMLRTYIPEYRKQIDFKDLQNGYDSAIRRAARLEREAIADEDQWRNPTTGMWRLTESIRTSGGAEE